MRDWQWGVLIAVGAIVLLVLGIRLLLRGRRVPNKAKLVIAGAILWLLSPIDPVPDVIPLAGVLDDLAVLIAAVRYVLDQVQPPEGGDRDVRAGLDRRAPVIPTDWRLRRDERGQGELPDGRGGPRPG